MHIVDQLVDEIKKKRNPICVGIDPNIKSIPHVIRESYYAQYGRNHLGASRALLQYSRDIIDVVAEHVPIVKFQMAYFEMFGYHGLQSLQQATKHARAKGLKIILDGKRNDIGSTAQAYSSAYLGRIDVGDDRMDSMYEADFLTVTPYLGTDGIKPFCQDAETYNKGLFVLTKTSNPSSGELQDRIVDGKPLYNHVASLVKNMSTERSDVYRYSRLGIVVGATYPEELVTLREHLPETFFLIPGFGFQGAGANELKGAFNKGSCGAIINSARNIIFAFRRNDYKDRFTERDFQKAAETAVLEMKQELQEIVQI